MRDTRIVVVAVIVIVFLFVSCDFPERVTGDFTGTITVSEHAYWEHVAIGLFHSSELDSEDSHYLLPVDNGEVWRVAYSNAKDGSTVRFAPAVPVPIVDNRNSPTERSYGVDIPVESMPAGASYYLVAWYDSNLDGKLDLRDAEQHDPDTIAKGEFNRLPYFYSEDTLYWMGSVYYSEAESTFKYATLVPGQGGGTPVTDTMPDFDFTITADTGF